MKKDDRRVKRTKKAIQEALAELMLEKELQSITIQELADKADIHRATFYTHYEDVYDLYSQMEQSAIDEINEIITNESYTYKEVPKIIVDYVFDNAKMSRLFLTKNLSRSFYHKMSKFLEEICLEHLCDFLNEEASEKWSYLVSYHVQGYLAIIIRWIKQDFALPKEDIVKMLIQVETHFLTIGKF
ncbi:MAG: TetR/AcrR family transcriptional regulator C-terminal domain-containing protein [Defluviitaleaceae bacterium]|nr:TetR/AcrR family transcriptional regulator C-terminal domain-containing protein [Defluviitaleaceae bacterium]